VNCPFVVASCDERGLAAFCSSPLFSPALRRISRFEAHRIMQRLSLASALSFVSLSVTGCFGVSTDYGSVELAHVSGTVTLDGKPLPGVTVLFEAPDKTTAFGTTDAGGAYALQFNTEKAGVTPGPKVVRIRGGGFGEDADAAEESEEEVAAPQAAPTNVPACYDADSKLQATVASGSQTMNFDLKSDCSVTGPTG
jgi:hypothetical protein